MDRLLLVTLTVTVLCNYIVSIGLVESLVRRIDKVHESIENETSLVLSLLASLGLLTKLVEICPAGESIPPRTTSLAAATFNLLVTFANLNLEAFQAVLIEQNLSLKFLDVISILLQYCVPKADVKSETQTVIIDLIATLGFFCANNKINQLLEEFRRSDMAKKNRIISLLV
uniref:Uncharacterized protein n=1 Tax=Anopheles culicifacies TaxID=139723 RepID=A0A182M5U7_9DIPT